MSNERKERRPGGILRRGVPIVFSVVLIAFAVTVLMRVRAPQRGEASPEARPAALPTVARGAATQAASSAAAPEALSPRGTAVVRISSARTMTSETRHELARLGVKVIAPVGARAVMAETSPHVWKALAKTGRFTVEPVAAEKKVQPQLAQLVETSDAATLPVAVVALDEADRKAVAGALVAAGGTLRKVANEPDVVFADIAPDQIAGLAARGDVRWIEFSPTPHVFNDISASVGHASVEPVRARHFLRGKGQIVTVSDSGFDTGDPANCHKDFTGRVLEAQNFAGYTEADFNGHGTHVMGTVLGDGTRSKGQYKGMAPEAKLIALGCGDKAGSGGIYFGDHPYRDCFTNGLSRGSALHSSSWGSDNKGAYDIKSQAVDVSMWKHPELLVVIANGNAGENGVQTVGSPATAKNALSVGNGMSARKDDPENLLISSSRGPTADGRIKPEIVAPGTSIVSTRSSKSGANCPSWERNASYTEMTGTSMATPLVAGSAALVREWLMTRRGYTNELPSGALVKAILTGGTVPMTGKTAKLKADDDGDLSPEISIEIEDEEGIYDLSQTYPNNDTGWGRIDLDGTLYPTNAAVKLFDRVPFADGVTKTYTITTTNAGPLRVQLVWTDAPADLSAEHTLVNDLDLIVSNKTSGAVWYGNDIVGGDHTNTVESVRIDAAEEGEYALLVRGTAVPYSSQEGGAAALYVRGVFEDETAPDPVTVRIADGDTFGNLEDALAAVQEGDTVEIVAPTELRKSVTVISNCTLVATNGMPALSLVTRTPGAAITVAAGVTLTVSNSAFSVSSETLVNVVSNGVLAIGANVDWGIPVNYGTAVATADARSIRLVGDPGTRFAVDCTVASGAPHPFGSWDAGALAYEAASGIASNIVCAQDPDALTFGSAGTDGTLAWAAPAEKPVFSDSAAYFVDADGVTNCARRTETVVAAFLAAHKAGTLGSKPEFVIRAPGAWPSSLEVEGELIVRGEGLGAITNVAPAAGFRVKAGGSLTVRNLSFANYSGNALFLVDGGALTLEDMRLESLYGTNSWSGALAVFSGSANVLRTTFDDCRAIGKYSATRYTQTSCGGAIYLDGEDAQLTLEDSTVTNCVARSYGGAIYAGKGAAVSLGGAVRLAGNAVDQKNPCGTGLYLKDSDTVLGVTRALTGGALSVPVRYGDTESEGNKAGFTFARNTSGSPFGASDMVLTAQAFANEADSNLIATDPTGAGLAFAWIEDADDPRQSPTAFGATAKRVTDAGTTTYWYRVQDALSEAGDGDAVTVLATDSLTEGFTLASGAITLTAADATAVTLLRDGGIVTVPSNTALTVTDIRIESAPRTIFDVEVPANVAEGPLFAVDGGSLTLTDAELSGLVGNDARHAAAISVWNGGALTLGEGAIIRGCTNLNELCSAGGVSVEGVGTSATFAGCEITACAAAHGAGAFIGSEAKLSVSGATHIEDNVLLYSEAPGNLMLADSTALTLTGALTRKVGVSYGEGCDEDVIGSVATNAVIGFTALTNSAVCFKNDATGSAGVAVKNAQLGETLLVWGSATDAEGSFTVERDDGTHVFACQGDIPVMRPAAIPGLVYNGQVQTGVVAVAEANYVVSNNTGVCASNYTAEATLLDPGYRWDSGESVTVAIPWTIARATYDMSGVAFTNATFVADGTAKSIFVSGPLPDGVSVSYAGNGKKDAGTYKVTAYFTGDADNYEPIAKMVAYMTIVSDQPVVEILPTLPENATANDVEQALADANGGAGLADQTARDAILAADDPVAAYKDFKAWANTVTGGEKAVAESTYARVTWAFKSTELFSNPPTVTFTYAAARNGTLEVALTVKDGDTPHAVNPKAAASMFELSADLKDWIACPESIVTKLPEEQASTISCTVSPDTTQYPTAFLRLKE